MPLGFRANALTGGFSHDPDLAPPECGMKVSRGLHVLRHISRYLDSLGLHLVITGERDSQLEWELTLGYDDDVAAAELRNYRFARTARAIRKLLAHDPRAVLLFGMSGSTCIGWRMSTWEGTRLDTRLTPGRLFLMKDRMVQQVVKRGHTPQEYVHLLAWQAPFPTHRLVSWGLDAELMNFPCELRQWTRQAAGFAFHHGRLPGFGGPELSRWWGTAPVHTLSSRQVTPGSLPRVESRIAKVEGEL